MEISIKILKLARKITKMMISDNVILEQGWAKIDRDRFSNYKLYIRHRRMDVDPTANGGRIWIEHRDNRSITIQLLQIMRNGGILPEITDEDLEFAKKNIKPANDIIKK